MSPRKPTIDNSDKHEREDKFTGQSTGQFTGQSTGQCENNRRKMRDALRQRRREISLSSQQQAAAALVDSVLEVPQWEQAIRVALYTPFDGEIDTTPLANLAQAAGKQVYMPVIGQGKTLRFGLWSPDQPTTRNRYGIAQPDVDSFCDAHEMDIVFVPLVAFDLAGNRLGMGGGYYDRALASAHGVTTVGVAHTCQRVDAIDTQPWDIALLYVATDSGLHDAASP